MIEIILTNKAELQRIAVVLLIAFAWRWGAGPERASAATLAIFLVADPVYHLVIGREASFMVVELGHVVLDCVVGGLLITIALRANRLYPLALAAFQMLAILSHIGRSLSASSAPLAYSILTFVPSYLLIVTLAFGLATHARRRARWGSYRSWWNDRPPWRTTLAERCN